MSSEPPIQDNGNIADAVNIEENADAVTIRASDLHLKLRELPKEATARTIAHSLLLTFRYSLWGTLLLGYATILVDYWGGKVQAGMLVKESVVPMVTSVGTFASILFGPLLAFVLGYYFGERKNQ